MAYANFKAVCVDTACKLERTKADIVKKNEPKLFFRLRIGQTLVSFYLHSVYKKGNFIYTAFQH